MPLSDLIILLQQYKKNIRCVKDLNVQQQEKNTAVLTVKHYVGTKYPVLKDYVRVSLVVQWLRICCQCRGHRFEPSPKTIQHAVGQLSLCPQLPSLPPLQQESSPTGLNQRKPVCNEDPVRITLKEKKISSRHRKR